MCSIAKKQDFKISLMSSYLTLCSALHDLTQILQSWPFKVCPHKTPFSPSLSLSFSFFLYSSLSLYLLLCPSLSLLILLFLLIFLIMSFFLSLSHFLSLSSLSFYLSTLFFSSFPPPPPPPLSLPSEARLLSINPGSLGGGYF